MRSSAGVGMTPPKVDGAPKPSSSVMISRTFGAPFGGTTRGGHQGADSEAFSLITPPNFGSGGGSCLPLMVVVAPGEPSVPVTCCALAGPEANKTVQTRNSPLAMTRFICMTPPVYERAFYARGYTTIKPTVAGYPP